jgi:hypothetical protein
MDELGLKEADFLQRHSIPIDRFMKARKILNDPRSDIMPPWVHQFIMQLVEIVNSETGNNEEAQEAFFRELLGRGGSQQDSILHEP